MNEPTDKQIKEFWEWCGQVTVRRVRSHEPGSFRDQADYPTLDLNNLFKYAVPKLDEETKKAVFDEWLYLMDVNRNEDPALALFWAIYEVSKGTK